MPGKAIPKLFEIHQKYVDLYGKRVFSYTQLYRILVLLERLSSTRPDSGDREHIDEHHVLQAELQERFFTEVGSQPSRPPVTDAGRLEMTRRASSSTQGMIFTEDHAVNHNECAPSRKSKDLHESLVFQPRASDIPGITALDAGKRGSRRPSRRQSGRSAPSSSTS